METHGTSGVVVWTPRKIIIGADGLLRHESALVGAQAMTHSCKIRRCGKHFWLLMAGVYASTGTAYDAWSLANQACEHSPTVELAAEHAAALIQAPLLQTIERMKTEGSVELKRLEQAGTYLQFAIAGFNESIASVAARQFRPGGAIDVLEYPGGVPYQPQSAARLLMGDHQAFMEFEAEHPNWYFSNDRASLIQSQLNEQIRLFPETAGHPISILSIEADKVQWIHGEPVPVHPIRRDVCW